MLYNSKNIEFLFKAKLFQFLLYNLTYILTYYLRAIYISQYENESTLVCARWAPDGDYRKHQSGNYIKTGL